MLTKASKNQTRLHVHDRIRKKLQGTSERPRLNVYRSLNHIYVQVIDDLKGQTIVSANGRLFSRPLGNRSCSHKRPMVCPSLIFARRRFGPLFLEDLVPYSLEELVKPEIVDALRYRRGNAVQDQGLQPAPISGSIR